MPTNQIEFAYRLALLLPNYVADPEQKDGSIIVKVYNIDQPEKGILVNCQDRSKYNISLLYPRDKKGGHYVPDHTQSITVSKDRGVEAVAKDIIRKLLPGYDEEFAKQLERKRKIENYANKKMALRDKIVELLEDTIAPHQQDSQEITIYNFGVDWIRAESDSVTFKVDLPEEIAIEFCSWLKDRMDRKNY